MCSSSQTLDAEAGRRFRLLADLLEDRFQVLHLLPGLLLVLLQRLLDLRHLGFPLQLRQHLQDLLFRAHGVGEFMNEQIAVWSLARETTPCSGRIMA
ncbi:MAG: hypothetical protein U0031_06890 [Thermomicrobiales bacterium]